MDKIIPWTRQGHNVDATSMRVATAASDHHQISDELKHSGKGGEKVANRRLASEVIAAPAGVLPVAQVLAFDAETPPSHCYDTRIDRCCPRRSTTIDRAAAAASIRRRAWFRV